MTHKKNDHHKWYYHFEASVPFWAYKAKKQNCILNTKRGSISFIAYIKDFRFERTLMEEHFNDNIWKVEGILKLHSKV
jgi:hypothetical protein